MTACTCAGIAGTMPTGHAAQRKGDFSELLKLGSRYQIYDPAPLRRAAQRPLQPAAPGGQHHPGQPHRSGGAQDPPFWPEANRTGTVDGRDNYFESAEPRLGLPRLHGPRGPAFQRAGIAFFRAGNSQYENLTQTIRTPAIGNLDDNTGYGAWLWTTSTCSARSAAERALRR